MRILVEKAVTGLRIEKPTGLDLGLARVGLIDRGVCARRFGGPTQVTMCQRLGSHRSAKAEVGLRYEQIVARSFLKS